MPPPAPDDTPGGERRGQNPQKFQTWKIIGEKSTRADMQFMDGMSQDILEGNHLFFLEKGI